MIKRLLIGLWAISLALIATNLLSTTSAYTECVDEMIIPDSVMALPGGTVRVPVYGQVCGGPPGPCEGMNLDAVTSRADFDTACLRCVGVDYFVTGTDNMGNNYTTLYDVLPSGIMFSWIGDYHQEYVLVGACVFMSTPPWPPDTYRFWDLLFEVSDTLPEGDCCPIQLTLSGHASNYFNYSICPAYPELNDGSIYYPPGLDKFIRGDYDGDGLVLTNDPLMIFQWYYGVPGAIPPSCEDAADYNDDGSILINDPLMALQYIFGRPHAAGPPPAPYPDCGPDLTGDPLDCEWHEFCMGKRKAAAYKPSVSVEDAVNKLVAGEVTPVDGVVRVPVDLTVSEAVCGFDISLGYDASSLRFKEVVGGDGYDFYAVDTREEGVVRIGGVPDIEMAELMGAGTHRVTEIVFITEKEADVELDWRKVEVYGSNMEALSVEWVDGVVKAEAGLPKEFALSQNYPNPFNSTTLIRYILPAVSGAVPSTGQPSAVSLEVYNILGQKVATLVDGHQKAGYKVVSWNAQDMSSGVYFYKLTAGDFVSVRKMVLLK